jgi:hypothetical protein
MDVVNEIVKYKYSPYIRRVVPKSQQPRRRSFSRLLISSEGTEPSSVVVLECTDSTRL